jgi:hypothetical protein
MLGWSPSSQSLKHKDTARLRDQSKRRYGKTPASEPQKRPFNPFSYDAKNIREFAFPDGRPVSIHKHSVHWAAPLKDDLATCTLVGVKGGKAPIPLKVVYSDFVTWWKSV